MNFQAMASPVRSRFERARKASTSLDVAVKTFKKYSEDDGGTYASALTYYIFFSIFPLLLGAAAILGFVAFADEEIKRDIIEKGVGGVPLLRDVLDLDSLNSIGQNRGLLALAALLLAIYAGSGAVRGLKRALDHFDDAVGQADWKARMLRPIAWLAGLGLITLASIALSAAGSLLNGVTATLVSTAAALATDTLLFLTMFKFLPEKSRSWGEVLPGAVVAAVGFEVLKVGGAVYLASGSVSRNRIFGPFAAAAALLIVCHLIAQVTLVSAEVNAALAEHRSNGQASPSRK